MALKRKAYGPCISAEGRTTASYMQGKISTWKYLSNKRHGFLELKEYPNISIFIHVGELTEGVKPEHIIVGESCRLLLGRMERVSSEDSD